MTILDAKRHEDLIFIFPDCHKYKKRIFFPLKQELSLSRNEHILKFMMHQYSSSVASESKLRCLELCIPLLHLNSLCLCSMNYFPFSPIGGMEAASKKFIYWTVAEFVKAWSMAYSPSKKHRFIESWCGFSFIKALQYLITALQHVLLISVL